MGGVYGEINSRADFERVLYEARTITWRRLQARPDNRTIESIDTQLDALQRWTYGGRTPTQEQRKTINVGIIAVRELEYVEEAEVKALVEKLYSLQAYVKYWPTDEQARNATDAGYLGKKS